MEIEIVASVIVDAAIQVHRIAGPGMLESTYETMLQYELVERGLSVKRQMYVDMRYKGMLIERAFCVDLFVDECIIVEVKSVEKLAPVHIRQLLTYQRMTNTNLGFLINFGQTTLKEGGIKRVMNGYAEPPKY